MHVVLKAASVWLFKAGSLGRLPNTIPCACSGLAVMQRLQTRSQFQATMSGGIISRTTHFALHRLVLGQGDVAKNAEQKGSGASLSQQAPQALFVVPGRSTPQVWIGSLIPKRWAKRSVTRHCIKRQVAAVTEQFTTQLQLLPPAAYVVRLRAGFDRKEFVSATSEPLKAAVRTELMQLLSYATRAKNRPLTADSQTHQSQAVAASREKASV